jgi:hypothetical protein
MTMEASPPSASIEEVVDLIPEELEDKKVRQRLRKLSRQLDALIAEQEGEVIVDQDALRRVVTDEEIFPVQVQGRVQRELKDHLGKRLKDKGKARQLRWQEFAARDTRLKPMAASELRRLGINSTVSLNEAREILRDRFPELPEAVIDADAPQLREFAFKALQHNRTVWDCVVSKLGFWAALGIFAAAGAFLIVGTATGPWGVPLAIWLIGVIGGGSAVIVANCVLNPNC